MQQTHITIVLALMVAILLEGSAGASDTEFTYQGSLKENGQSTNGLFDLEFSLWDAAAGGNQIESTIVFSGVQVTDGLFTVELDFGSTAFDNSDRWLEIVVNATTLSPRQPITRSPYSIQTRGIFVNGVGLVGIGTIVPLDELHVRGVQATLRLEDTVDPLSFTEVKDAQPTQLRINKINNNGLVFFDLNPKPMDGMSNASVRLFRETTTTGLKGLHLHRGNNTSQLSALIGVDGADSFLQAHGGKLGIGTTTPVSKLHVVHNNFDDEAAIFATNFATGVHGVGGPGVLGESVFGAGVAGLSSNQIGVFGSSDNPGGFDFFAAGLGVNYGASSSNRWKENIHAIENPLAMIEELRGVYFEWDAEHGGHHDVGMIAEEVGKVLPEIVNYEENGSDAIGMDYSKLTPLLVESIKAIRAEKQSEIAALREDNESLRAEKDAEIAVLRSEKNAEIAGLRERLAALEALLLTSHSK